MKYFSMSLLVASLFMIFSVRDSSAQRTGVEIWVQTCGNCHTNQPTDRYTSEKWDSIMDHMKLTARMTDEESELVLEFLRSGARQTASAEIPARGHVIQASPATFIPNVGQAPSSSLEARRTFDPEKSFKALCVACHGKKGKGDGVAAPALNPKPPNFSSPVFQASRTTKELVEAITNGKGSMPKFVSQLSKKQIESIALYIRSLEMK